MTELSELHKILQNLQSIFVCILNVIVNIVFMSASALACDFVIVSEAQEVGVSFHMMAITCGLFKHRLFPENRYETYVPVDRGVLETFVECVYAFVLNPESVKSKITSENVHYLALLADEFRCGLLKSLVQEFMTSSGNEVEAHVDGLVSAVRQGNDELCARFEELLAEKFERALEVFGRIPISGIPTQCLHRIIERAVRDDPENVNESLLCDVVLAKVEDDDNDCALVEFLHLDKLPWAQVEKLFRNEKLRKWFCAQFPVRFLDEVVVHVNKRVADVESSLGNRISQIEAVLAEVQAENKRFREIIDSQMKIQKTEMMDKVADLECADSALAEDMRSGFEMVEKKTTELREALEGRVESLVKEMQDSREPVCTYATHGTTFFGQKLYHCDDCGLVGRLVCCEACAKICHAGHRIRESGFGSGYCDCGAGAVKHKCTLYSNKRTSPTVKFFA